MKLTYQQNEEKINEEDCCEACGNSQHWGKPLLLEGYRSICFNGILVEVTAQEMAQFKKSIKKYEKENGST